MAVFAARSTAMNIDSLPSGTLLIVHHESKILRSRERVARALAALECAPVRGSAFIYQLKLVNDWSDALRQVAHACSSDGASAWLVSELPPTCDDGASNRRLQDRSADFAAGVAAWRAANAPFPMLEPGDMVRL